jgi:hypothetical protein
MHIFAGEDGGRRRRRRRRQWPPIFRCGRNVAGDPPARC